MSSRIISLSSCPVIASLKFGRLTPCHPERTSPERFSAWDGESKDLLLFSLELRFPFFSHGCKSETGPSKTAL